jgi:hypothetical protein
MSITGPPLAGDWPNTVERFLDDWEERMAWMEGK